MRIGQARVCKCHIYQKHFIRSNFQRSNEPLLSEYISTLCPSLRFKFLLHRRPTTRYVIQFSDTIYYLISWPSLSFLPRSYTRVNNGSRWRCAAWVTAGSVSSLSQITLRCLLHTIAWNTKGFSHWGGCGKSGSLSNNIIVHFTITIIYNIPSLPMGHFCWYLIIPRPLNGVRVQGIRMPSWFWLIKLSV